MKVNSIQPTFNIQTSVSKNNPNFGVSFDKGNIKSMVAKDIKRLYEFQAEPAKFDYSPEKIRECCAKIKSALEQFPKALSIMAKTGDKDTKVDIYYFEEWKRQTVWSANHWVRGFKLFISNPKFNDEKHSIFFKHGFDCNSEFIPPEKSTMLAITPFLDCIENVKYTKNAQVAINSENPYEKFIQSLEFDYAILVAKDNQIKISDLTKTFGVDDPHWKEIEHKLGRLQAKDYDDFKTDNVNRKVDEYMAELDI